MAISAYGSEQTVTLGEYLGPSFDGASEDLMTPGDYTEMADVLHRVSTERHMGASGLRGADREPYELSSNGKLGPLVYLLRRGELTSDDLAWKEAGQCNGLNPNIFFPKKEEPKVLEAAREICKMCAVQEQCAEYAIQNGEKFGVWGGLSERERRDRRQQARATRSTLAS